MTRKPRAAMVGELVRLVVWEPMDESCIEWPRGCFSDGYGAIDFEGKLWRAHRLAWHLFVGDIPSGMFVCHRCDNHPCVRLSHLFLGTALDNMRDKVEKGRLVAPIGERNGRRKLSWDDVRDIRARYVRTSPVIADLACQYGIDRDHVHAIAAGKYWNASGR